MSLELNHLIVPVRDKEEAARFWARIFGLAYAGDLDRLSGNPYFCWAAPGG